MTASSNVALQATSTILSYQVAIVGGGPAGLMAAQILSQQGYRVCVFDRKASVGRKFLLAGKGGLNLTHSEPFDDFVTRYGSSAARMQPLLNVFGPQQVHDWVASLGLETFVGSSGRVFPTDMKAAPLLRQWMTRLRSQGVQFAMRHRWVGWTEDDHLMFDNEGIQVAVKADAVLFAMGGGSWSRLGSDGQWIPALEARGIAVQALQSSNCGFDVGPRARVPHEDAKAGWSDVFGNAQAGQPLKNVSIAFKSSRGDTFFKRGEFVITSTGVEGSLIYAASSLLREEINAKGFATFHLDLLPAWTAEKLEAEVKRPRGSRSLSSHLKSRLGLDGVRMALLHEVLSKEEMQSAEHLARSIKVLPLTVVTARPMDEAISTAGGVDWEAVDNSLMSKKLPGLFFAGEMLDWEAPTGGYLLTGCLATAVCAAQGVDAFLRTQSQ